MMAFMSVIGRIGRDAEIRYTGAGDPVINLSIAYNYGRRDDEGKQPTQWVEAGLWGSRAEKLAEHLKKGKRVQCLIEEPHEEKFTKADGTTATKWTGRVMSIDFLDPRDESEQRSTQAPARPRGAPPARQRAQAPAKAGSGFEDMDDDIPF